MMLSSLILLATVVAANNPAPAPAETSFTMLTWNIQMLPKSFAVFSDNLQKMQEERAPWIVDFLKQQDYDLLCLEEIFDAEAIKVLKSGLKTIYPHVVPPQFAPGQPLSNGVMFFSRFPIEYIAHITFAGLEDEEVLTSKGCCLIQGQKGGVTFQIAGTHFPTGKQSIKDQAIIDIEEKLLKPHRRPGVPQFMLGDFNISEGSSEYAKLLATCQMKDFSLNDPRPYSIDPLNSWKGEGERPKLIDHILLDANGTESSIMDLKIQRPTHAYNGKDIDLADHYGVFARVTVGN